MTILRTFAPIARRTGSDPTWHPLPGACCTVEAADEGAGRCLLRAWARDGDGWILSVRGMV